jgi:CBS domain-containing protein
VAVRVVEIMSSPVVTMGPEDSLKDAARLLVERDVSAAPVLDDKGNLVGMVSEADVMQLELHEDPRRHLRPSSDDIGLVPQRVAEVMTRDVLVVPPDHDVADVAALLLNRRIRSVPVVSSGRVEGIVSRRDVLRVLLRGDADIAHDLEDILTELPPSLGAWAVRVDAGVVHWIGDGPDDVPPFLSRVAFTVPGVVDVQVIQS